MGQRLVGAKVRWKAVGSFPRRSYGRMDVWTNGREGEGERRGRRGRDAPGVESMQKVTSHWRTTSAGVDAMVTLPSGYCPATCSTQSEVVRVGVSSRHHAAPRTSLHTSPERFQMTKSDDNFVARFFTMPLPMMPMPTKPIFCRKAKVRVISSETGWQRPRPGRSPCQGTGQRPW